MVDVLRGAKILLKDEIVYEPFLGIDRTHARKYGEPVTIDSVRVDFGNKYHHNGQEEVLDSVATIFYYPSLSSNRIDFKVQDRVVVRGEAYEVNSLKIIQAPFGSSLEVYEVGIV